MIESGSGNAGLLTTLNDVLRVAPPAEPAMVGGRLMTGSPTVTPFQ
ncbi:MAG TPA: hypothetical protein VF657_24935 [Actinoplanes sp.]